MTRVWRSSWHELAWAYTFTFSGTPILCLKLWKCLVTERCVVQFSPKEGALKFTLFGFQPGTQTSSKQNGDFSQLTLSFLSRSVLFIACSQSRQFSWCWLLRQFFLVFVNKQVKSKHHELLFTCKPAIPYRSFTKNLRENGHKSKKNSYKTTIFT